MKWGVFVEMVVKMVWNMGVIDYVFVIIYNYEDVFRVYFEDLWIKIFVSICNEEEFKCYIDGLFNFKNFMVFIGFIEWFVLFYW